MTLKNIIRKGDKTSHGGTVLESINGYSVLGIEVACKGHQVICPLCKGTFPIIDGISSMPIHGKHPAVEGMKTACGAKLIASQDIYKLEQVNGGVGKVITSSDSTSSFQEQSKIETDYGARFFAKDSETGLPMRNARYFALVNDVEVEGYTDDNGYATIHANGPDDVIKFHMAFVTPKRSLDKEGE